MRNCLQTTICIFLIIILTLVFVVYTTPAFAQPPEEYQTISPLPGTEIVRGDEPGVYFNNIFKIFVAVISILAVIKLMLCGFQYMTSEAISSKENAKKCIWAVIFGLFLILLSFLILQTINPELTKLHFDALKQGITPTTIPIDGGPPNTSPTPTPIGQPPAGSTLVGNVVECERPSISVVNACETDDSEQAKCISGGCTWSSHHLPGISVCAC